MGLAYEEVNRWRDAQGLPRFRRLTMAAPYVLQSDYNRAKGLVQDTMCGLFSQISSLSLRVRPVRLYIGIRTRAYMVDPIRILEGALVLTVTESVLCSDPD